MTVLESAWSPTTSATLAAAATWLKSSTDPAYNVEVCLAGGSLTGVQRSPLWVHEAEGRRYPIVHQGTVHGEQFTIALAFNDDAEWDAFTELRDRAEPMLLQTPYGDSVAEQFWLRFGDAKRTRYTTDDMTGAQARVVEFDAVQVGVPGGV